MVAVIPAESFTKGTDEYFHGVIGQEKALEQINGNTSETSAHLNALRMLQKSLQLFEEQIKILPDDALLAQMHGIIRRGEYDLNEGLLPIFIMSFHQVYKVQAAQHLATENNDHHEMSIFASQEVPYGEERFNSMITTQSGRQFTTFSVKRQNGFTTQVIFATNKDGGSYIIRDIAQYNKIIAKDPVVSIDTGKVVSFDPLKPNEYTQVKYENNLKRAELKAKAYTLAECLDLCSQLGIYEPAGSKFVKELSRYILDNLHTAYDTNGNLAGRESLRNAVLHVLYENRFPMTKYGRCLTVHPEVFFAHEYELSDGRRYTKITRRRVNRHHASEQSAYFAWDGKSGRYSIVKDNMKEVAETMIEDARKTHKLRKIKPPFYI